ncbi:hypothetical protein D9619_003171 [Psilocybe cf. subviscida]|uniref:FAM192A/Fyv6 N-terminal domain-containing protein n=1 Tax=Psilocybe cf. subviscida TaxID=2480587 RepID=A0A8H5AYI8_9AGAR|nr:hypothetical protein D9619_003171 [Psilocybe cf. subviscida]
MQIKLAANKIAKQEEWEEKTKLANQFRALEEDEIMFLDSIREKQEEEDRQRKEKDGEEVRSFKEAVAARTSAASGPPPVTGLLPPQTDSSTAKPKPVAKKDLKKALKGVVVKRKPKTTPPKQDAPAKETGLSEDKASKNKAVDDGAPSAKRRKIESS